jgi:hypothetical protein
MEEALRFFKTYEALIYLALGGLALWEIRKFSMAWNEVRGAAFGLERDSAQGRLNRSAIALMLILAIAMAEFMLVTFIAPTVPGALPISTPTVDLLATPTVTIQPSPTTEDPEATPPTPTPDGWPPEESGCIPDNIMLTSPRHQEQIYGKVSIEGTVDFPNLAFHKYEVQRPGDQIWHTLQAVRDPKIDELLGEWETNLLSSGEYILRVVAIDHQGLVLGTCEIQVHLISQPGS